MSGTQGLNGVAGRGRGIDAVAAGGPAGDPTTAATDTELRPRTGGRRRFTTAYMLRVVEQAQACAAGEVGALLRREGLYSSHLAKWRRQHAAGLLSRDGTRTMKAATEAARHTAKVERENRRLRQRLERAETIISV